MRTILLTVEYDGSRFCGWQRQPNVRTVQGVLESALTRLLGQEIRVDGASRTDAGVHALGQRATFSGEFGIPTDRIRPALNHLLRGRTLMPGPDSDVRVVSCEEKPDGFHARFDSVGKKYRYVIRNEEELPVFERNYCCQVPARLDLDRMKRAAKHLIGTHDFACFQAAGGTPRETTVRTIHGIRVRETGGSCEPGGSREPGESCDSRGRTITIEVSGDGFLYNMVRILSGTLIEAGLGKREPDSIPDLLLSKDRRQAGFTAPPGGLYLVEVYYGPEEPGRTPGPGTELENHKEG
ncbi:MAG: tRNA pseudouridine(38-40) synthase TruA [Anaerovoracaceae bacterium]|jgi:tRNA pseudouridine38-40 synthase